MIKFIIQDQFNEKFYTNNKSWDNRINIAYFFDNKKDLKIEIKNEMDKFKNKTLKIVEIIKL